MTIESPSDAQDLTAQILDLMGSPEVIEQAARNVEASRRRGLVSDWDACGDKVACFARLVVAAARVLGPGGSIETGIFRGGSAGPLILAASPAAFHVSIDPFGLPAQAYPDNPDYGSWSDVRETLWRLAELGRDCQVTVCHYLTDSQSFIAGDLLRHPGRFRIVHLDGDHSFEVVRQELLYFRSRIAEPAIFILDDHDENFPGVEQALRDAGRGMIPILHQVYDFPEYGRAGFSAWLHAPELAN